MQTMFSNCIGIKLEIISRNKFRKYTYICKINNVLLKMSSRKKSQGKFENILRLMKIKMQHCIYKIQLKECLEGNLLPKKNYIQRRKNNLDSYLES